MVHTGKQPNRQNKMLVMHISAKPGIWWNSPSCSNMQFYIVTMFCVWSSAFGTKTCSLVLEKNGFVVANMAGKCHAATVPPSGDIKFSSHVSFEMHYDIYCRNVEVTHKKYTTRGFLERSYSNLGLCFINCRHKIMFKNKKNISKKLKESVIWNFMQVFMYLYIFLLLFLNMQNMNFTEI